MILKQYYLNCLAHASYVIADEETGVAAVVDPQRDIEQYMAFAAEHGLTIQHVFLTHLHADFIAGHLELRDRTSARIYLGKQAKAEYAFTPLGDGDRVELGRVRIEALETPGHTPESVCLLVFDLDVSDTVPHAVLTGDTLFVGDVGRPDLRASLGWSAADLGGMLYDSIHRKVLRLPDVSLVYPAHGAGSLCGKAISKETVSTIGAQRRENYALQPMSKDAFLALVTEDQPNAPSYFTYDAVLNSRERPTLDEALAREMQPYGIDDVLAAQRGGAQILDTRDATEFAAAHLRGSINVGLGGQFATWAGTVLDRERPVIIVSAPGAERESALRLGRIGLDIVSGYLDGGLVAAGGRPDLIVSTERLSPEVTALRMQSAEPPLLVDVRSRAERAQKTIQGSMHVPLDQLVARASELPRDRALIVHCAGGYRSSIAASLLQSAGYTTVSELAGGISAWQLAQGPNA